MAKESRSLLDWRKKQERGAIMKRTVFDKIKRRASEAGAANPEAVAGKAYWKTAEAKFKKQRS